MSRFNVTILATVTNDSADEARHDVEALIRSAREYDYINDGDSYTVTGVETEEVTVTLTLTPQEETIITETLRRFREAMDAR